MSGNTVLQGTNFIVEIEKREKYVDMACWKELGWLERQGTPLVFKRKWEVRGKEE